MARTKTTAATRQQSRGKAVGKASVSKPGPPPPPVKSAALKTPANDSSNPPAVEKKPRKPRRNRPGTVAKREIRNQQKNSWKKKAIPMAALCRVIKEVGDEIRGETNSPPLRWQKNAVLALGDATEHYGTTLFIKTRFMALKAKRKTVFPEDMNDAKTFENIAKEIPENFSDVFSNALLSPAEREKLKVSKEKQKTAEAKLQNKQLQEKKEKKENKRKLAEDKKEDGPEKETKTEPKESAKKKTAGGKRKRQEEAPSASEDKNEASEESTATEETAAADSENSHATANGVTSESKKEAASKPRAKATSKKTPLPPPPPPSAPKEKPVASKTKNTPKKQAVPPKNVQEELEPVVASDSQTAANMDGLVGSEPSQID